MSRRKVILAAPNLLFDYFSRQYPHWDLQVPCESVGEMWEKLGDGQLSSESDIVIFSDTLFDVEPEEFIDAVASFAPEALVMILSYNDNEDYIRRAVADKVHAEKLDESEYYFIRKDVALKEIDELVDFFDNGQKEAEQIRAHSITVDEPAVHKTKVDTSKKGLVVTVTSSKGGSGKSSVAVLTATQLAHSSQKAFEEGRAKAPLKVCVVDLDTFDGQLGFVLGSMAPTALNIALSESVFDADLVANNLVYNERMGIHALLAPVRGATARYTDPKFYRKVIRILKTMFDVVILDTSVQHYDDLIKTVALPEADAILLVTTLDIKSVKGLARWMNVARTPVDQGGHGVDHRKIGIVVNGSIQGVGMDNEKLARVALDAPLLVAIPLDTKAVQSAGNHNRLEDIIQHPTIGPAYYKLAEKLSKPKGFVLSPVLETTNQMAATPPKKAAPAPDTSGGTTKRSFFGKRK